jgi:hypothetical protein
VQRALDAGAVVLGEAADPRHHVRQVVARHRLARQVLDPAREAGLGGPAEVEHHLQQLVQPGPRLERGAHRRRHHRQQQVEVVGDPDFARGQGDGSEADSGAPPRR